MGASCVFCDLPTSGSRRENCVKCSECDSFAHFSCLSEKTALSNQTLLGDVFYSFKCRSCSVSNTVCLIRDKLSWLTVLIIALYNLQEQPHLNRHGFFHWKLHIVDFIDRKWNYLFGSGVRRKRTWHGTVSGTLSHYSPTFFQTGSDILKEPGWWKLTYSHLSPFETMMMKHEANYAPSKKATHRTSEDKACISLSKNNDMTTDTFTSTSDLDLLNYSDSESLDVDIDVDMDVNNDQGPFSSGGCSHLDTSLSELVDLCVSNEEIISQCEESTKAYRSAGTAQEDPMCEFETDPENNSDNETIYACPTKGLFVCTPPRPYPWICKSVCLSDEKCSRTQPMAEYDELKLLQKLSKYVDQNTVKIPQGIQRLYRKLCVRREQRHRRLTPFSDLLLSVCNFQNDGVSTATNTRTLDRYQVHGCFKWAEQLHPSSFIPRLVGKVERNCFVSPYTERLLKPFIRRDFNCKPPKLRLLSAIREKVNGINPLWRQPKQHPIDYSYVQPQHIPAVNSLCELFFWPGIDLSESLHYPDFSCVALYRKLVIGFAFMVPDVSNNESYISFLFTHPEWRRAGIATFMLYHIIQTCMGKDVTLHVSVTNPAVILYQKFGFKVEELAQDFYDKYFPNDSKECRHALFLRLCR